MTDFIPVCEPMFLGNEKKYLLDAIETGWISSAGKYIPAFEEAFASYCGVKHGIAVCNGTVALHLALTALGIGKGDEVIVPNFTMIASAVAVCYTGAKPVFVDAEPQTWNIDVEKLRNKIETEIEIKKNNNLKAIMVVHIYGHPCDMGPINEIARKYNLKIIEDAAEAHGAEYKGRKTGSLGDIAAFSFYANKNITTGEGGMVVTDNEELAEKCRYYKNLCFPLKGGRTYIHNDIGFNYRMSNLHAAIGLAQVEKADTYRAMRIRNAEFYRRYLSDLPGITLQPQLSDCLNVNWMNGVLIDPELYGHTRDELVDFLQKEGVDTRNFFVGMHRQSSMEKFGCDISGDYPVSDRLAENGFYLPSASNLKKEQIKRVCAEIRRFLK